MNRSDLPKIAAALAELGQVLGRKAAIPGRAKPVTVAEAMLDAAREYQPGQQSARLAPSTGRRIEPIAWPDGTTGLVDVPHDPAGETAITPDPTLDLPDRWLTVMSELDQAVTRAHKLVDVLLPPQPGTEASRCAECGAPTLEPKRRDRRQTGLDVAIEGWCRSCYRDDQRLHPIDTDRRGNRRYHDVCSWCGRFRGEHKRLPPVAVIRWRHQHGGRVPASVVTRALADEKRNRNHTKRTKPGTP